ncbi:MAG: diguanylate cyclase [Pseudomonadota bacterium]
MIASDDARFLLQHFLMYGVVPVWLLAGLADWACHRVARIERTSGVRETLLHLAQFTEVGIPMLAVLFLEVNAAVIAVMLVGVVLHQATAVWDVRYADRTRHIAPVEQHVHGVLEASPIVAVAIVAILHWPAFAGLIGIGGVPPDFALRLKPEPLPSGYLVAVLVGVVACGVVPFGEELVRTLRAAGGWRRKAL